MEQPSWDPSAYITRDRETIGACWDPIYKGFCHLVQCVGFFVDKRVRKPEARSRLALRKALSRPED